MTVARNDPLRWWKKNGYAIRPFHYDPHNLPTGSMIIVYDYDASGVYKPMWEVYDASEAAVQLRLWSEDA